MISIVPRYLEHKGGTKYYEVLIFASPTAEVMVKRYGEMSWFRKPGAGAEPIATKLRLNAQTMSARAEEEIKPKLTKSKGYDKVLVSHGFHNTVSDSQYSMDNEEFVKTLGMHYSTAFAETVVSLLGIGAREVEAVQEKVVALPRDRGNSWGSW